MSEDSGSDGKAGRRPPASDGTDSGDDVVRETWETGLRRRRGGSETSDGRAPRRGDVEGSGSAGVADGGGRTSPQHGGPPVDGSVDFACGVGGAGGIDGGGGGLASCGGGGGVGVLSSAGHAGAGAFGGGPSTPLKPLHPPTKDGIAGLVSPSSITTAGETAELTLATEVPLTPRSPGRSPTRASLRSARPPASPGLRRRYHLLRSQVLLLLASSSAGLLLFLFYALPLAAFVSLALLTSSLGALVPVARSFVRARYEVEMQHPLGLARYLPDYLRVMLTETSLHEFMTDDALFMEWRHMLIYFMPGLRPEQRAELIDRLPARHREALLRPGLGSLMPSVMGHLMRMEGHDDGVAGAARSLPMLEEGEEESVESGLTAGEHHEDGGGGDGDDAEVTLMEAVRDLGRTLAAVALGGEDEYAGDAVRAMGEMPSAPPAAMSSPSPVANADHARTEIHDQDDDGSSIDFSIDISATGLGDDVVMAPAARAAPADVIVALPPHNTDANDDQDEEEIQRRERELEGQILADAAAAAAANYGAQATEVASEAVITSVEVASSHIIRAGMGIGLASSWGGMMVAMMPRFVVTLGTTGGTTGGSGSAGGEGRPMLSSPWVRGLFATSAFGFVGAGVAYAVRNRARAVIAENRQRRLEEAPKEED